MNSLQIFLFVVLSLALVEAGSITKKKDDGPIQIQATNNTQVPSISYIVDAVECLREAYEIYLTDHDRVEAYVQLFNELHPGKWNVVAGYTAIHLDAGIFIETQVLGGGQQSKKDDPTDVKFLLFGSLLA